MYCKNCGTELTTGDECPVCGTTAGEGTRYCESCGREIGTDVDVCTNCGKIFAKEPITEEELNDEDISAETEPLTEDTVSSQTEDSIPNSATIPNAYEGTVEEKSPKSKVVAGLLAIFLGAFGVHNFYLGYTKKAIVQLSLTIVGLVLCCIVIGAFLVWGIQIWAFIEGIFLFIGKIGKDGQGRMLSD